MKNNYFLIGLILLLAVFLWNQNGVDNWHQQTLSSKSVKVQNINVDNYFVKGSNEQVFDHAPQRVVVVGENETETLLELGAAPNILAAVAQNNRRYAMKEKNWELCQTLNLCKSANLNMEYVTKLNPDLIVAQQCVFIRNRLNNTEYWNQRGVGTMVPLNTNSPSKHLHKETVAKEMEFITDLGKIFRLEDNARRIVAETYSTIDLINQRNKNYPKPKVMVVEFLSSFISYDNTKLVGNMVESIGGQVEETPPVIGMEYVMQANPDVLFVVCSHMDYGVCMTNIVENPALKNLQCIKNKRVYSIPLRFTYGSSCRTADGLRFLAERMYPDIDLKTH